MKTEKNTPDDELFVDLPDIVALDQFGGGCGLDSVPIICEKEKTGQFDTGALTLPASGGEWDVPSHGRLERLAQRKRVHAHKSRMTFMNKLRDLEELNGMVDIDPKIKNKLIDRALDLYPEFNPRPLCTDCACAPKPQLVFKTSPERRARNRASAAKSRARKKAWVCFLGNNIRCSVK